MLFNSIEFLLFFPVAVGIYYFPRSTKLRNLWLLVCSYFFYMSWNAALAFLIISSTLVDYIAGRVMHKNSSELQRSVALGTSVGLNLGLLFLFKYLGFFSSSFNQVFDILNLNASIPILDLLLPVGISFYTFQTLSYTIDVYRGNQESEKSLLDFSLYVAFFPQLVAGPIERSTNLLPQFKVFHKFSWPQVISGSQLMMWGFFQKIVVADRLAIYVNRVFDRPESYGTITILVAVLFFGIQIYADFAGYSNIAIGTARVMGFDLMRNFNLPYSSKSVTEFWRRWHISLSSWFRDYLYIPLGGSRGGLIKTMVNIMIVFLVSGLWHGASWGFVIWGGLHGFALAGERLWKELSKKMQAQITIPFVGILQLLATFIFVNFTWIFFRAQTISASYEFLRAAANFNLVFDVSLPFRGFYRGEGYYHLALSIVLIIFMEVINYWRLNHKSHLNRTWTRINGFLKVLIYAMFILMILLLGVFDQSEFIYFQF